MSFPSLLPPDWISVSEAAEMIPPARKCKSTHASPSMLYRLAKQKKIASEWCNGIRVSRTEIRSRFGMRPRK